MKAAWRQRHADVVRIIAPLLRAAGILVALLVLLTLAGLTNMMTPGTMAIPGVFASASGR